MFEPGEMMRTAFDPETRIKVKVYQTSEIHSPYVAVTMPDGRQIRCGLILEPKSQQGDQQLSQEGTSKIRLLLYELNRLAVFRDGTRDENTAFVRYVLLGLAFIHRKWPIMNNASFYTNRDDYKGRDLKALFAFDIPEAEIEKL